MSIEHELAAFIPLRPTLLTVGVFDSVHLGHQTLLRRLIDESASRGLTPGVVTFNCHPLSLLSPQKAPLGLAGPEENVRRIKALGIDLVISLTFDAAMAATDARAFALLLKHHLRMKGLVLGWDFAMGHHRSGTLTALADLGRQLDFTTEVVPAVTLSGETISSTAIRQALAEGNMTKARAMLGHPFCLEGIVVRGAGRGTGLGYPTANLEIDPGLIVPAEGVYATETYLDDRPYPSVTAVTRCPTFGATKRTIEIHILDFSGDIYGQRLRLDIIEYLRPARRFDGTGALSEQLARDTLRAREILSA